MKKHLNNKGYMLVEIVLASVLTAVVAYFITDLTIKLKNRNDDLLVKTLVSTDQAIIYNTIMKDLYSNYSDGIICDDIVSKINIDTDNKIFKYDDFTNIVSEYAIIGNVNCTSSNGEILINIPLEVKQLPDEDFDINIRYKM